MPFHTRQERERRRTERLQRRAAGAETRRQVIAARLRARRDEAIRFARAKERLRTQRRIQIRRRVLGLRGESERIVPRRARKRTRKRIRKAVNQPRRRLGATRRNLFDTFGGFS